MENEYDYNAIRPYFDEEVHSVIQRITTDPELLTVLKYIFPNKPAEESVRFLLSFQSIYDLQSKLIVPFFQDLLKKSSAGIDIVGLDKLIKEDNYLFISNHRDIILDAAFLNVLMLIKGFETAQNAIGDNLCVKPWITDAMKLNKNFIVQRSGSKREIFEASKRLSSYIRQNIAEKRSSVWIAQREGRAKDSDDRTQESLLKMLSMSSGRNLKQGFITLNIMPVSISYEYDACDFLKAKEFQQKRDNPEYKKTKEDDLLNMKTGLTGYKGRIHYEITGSINNELEKELMEADDRAAILKKVAEIIDRQIHKNYKIFPGNYIALDHLRNQASYLEKTYSAEEKEKFDQYIEQQIGKIDLADKDVPFLRSKLMEMYANPLINYLKALEK